VLQEIFQFLKEKESDIATALTKQGIIWSFIPSQTYRRRIVELHLGKDGYVRMMSVHTSTGTRSGRFVRYSSMPTKEENLILLLIITLFR